MCDGDGISTLSFFVLVFQRKGPAKPAVPCCRSFAKSHFRSYYESLLLYLGTMFRPFLIRAARVAPQVQLSSLSLKRSFHVTAAANAKLNVEGLADKVNLKGQNVLVRVDLNVPLAKVSIVARSAIHTELVHFRILTFAWSSKLST